MKTLIRILSFLPLSVLYALGDIITYPILYYLIRYRRRLVRENLQFSFPDKSADERKAIEKSFYHHLADIIAEVIWSYRATEEEMQAHITIDSIDRIEEWAAHKGGVIFMLGHLGNWEWTADIQHRFSNPQIQHYNVYRHLNNRSADAAMTAIREKRSGKGSNIEKNHLLRELVRLKKAQAMFTLGLVADQKPSPRNAHFHTTFLNQPTDFLTGGEVLAKKFDYVVTYVDITSPKRGYYTVRADLITDNAPGTRPDEITEQFAKRLEDNIRRQPQLWLWTHNRWKWSRQNQ